MNFPGYPFHGFVPPLGPQFIIVLNENDVLLGRGARIASNEGNRRLRELVQKKKSVYNATGRHAVKEEISREIFNTITQRGGRFLEKVAAPVQDPRLGMPPGMEVFRQVEESKALEKIKQALRDKDSRSREGGAKRPSRSSAEKPEKRQRRAAASSSISETGQPTPAVAAMPQSRQAPPAAASSLAPQQFAQPYQQVPQAFATQQHMLQQSMTSERLRWLLAAQQGMGPYPFPPNLGAASSAASSDTLAMRQALSRVPTEATMGGTTVPPGTVFPGGQMALQDPRLVRPLVAGQTGVLPFPGPGTLTASLGLPTTSAMGTSIMPNTGQETKSEEKIDHSPEEDRKPTAEEKLKSSSSQEEEASQDKDDPQDRTDA